MAFKSTLLNTTSSALTSEVFSLAGTPSLMMIEPDTEPIIEIDSDLRKITVPQELYNIGVQGDHLAETIFFTCPRYFDEKDLSEHSCIIRCINAGKEYFESPVVEMVAENDTLRFGWELDNRATRYSGVINFTVQFETVDNGVKYQWQTTPATLNILAGLNIEETITEKDDMLFRSLSNQVQSLQYQVDSLITEVEYLASMKTQLDTLTSEVNNLKNNVVYVHDDNEN